MTILAKLLLSLTLPQQLLHALQILHDSLTCEIKVATDNALLPCPVDNAVAKPPRNFPTTFTQDRNYDTRNCMPKQSAHLAPMLNKKCRVVLL